MQGVNEQHLAVLLKNFNKNIYLSYVLKLAKLISTYREGSAFPTIDIIRTPDLAGDLAFRVSFDFPVFIMLSHPICRFRSHRNYPIRENFYVANLGLVPVFFASLNLMTVLKLWGERADGFFNPTNSPLVDDSILCWELPQSTKSAEYSSMNFILQNSSDPVVADKYLTDIYEKYFRVAYWSFPRPGFSPSTHFLHGRTRISSQVKISKSLYVIEEIGRLRKFELEGQTIDAVEVQLRGLAENNGNYFFAHFPAFLDGVIAEQILRRENMKSSFINGIVAEIVQQGGRKLSLMTVVADYGESYFDILTALIGIVADMIYSTTDSVTEIGTVDDLRQKVFDLYLDIHRHLKVSPTLSETTSNSFEIALNSLFPCILTQEHQVMVVHPMIWGFLKKWNLLRTDSEEQSEILTRLLRLMKLSDKISFMKLFLDDDAEFFGRLGVSKSNFIKSILQLIKDIRFCKMNRQVLEQ